MNRKNKVLSIFILVVIVFTLYFSATSSGAVAPDILELTKGSYVKGELLFANTSLTNHLLANMEIKVEDIMNIADISLDAVQISVAYDIVEPDFLDNALHTFKYSSLILMNNRTYLIPIVELTMSNSSYSAGISLLGQTTLSGLTDINNAVVTINGQDYIVDDVDISHPKFVEIFTVVDKLLDFESIFDTYFVQTVFAISPQVFAADSINFHPSSGTVMTINNITISVGVSINSILVSYSDSFAFGFDDVDEVDVFYDSKTGLLIKSTESDTASDSHKSFVPSEVSIKEDDSGLPTGWLPYPIISILSGFVTAGLLVIFIRKKK